MVEAQLKVQGALSYLEVAATDPRQSASFYERVLGWTIHGDPDSPKFSTKDGRMIGRWATGRQPTPEPGITPYFYVDKLQAAVDAASNKGGTIVKQPFQEGDVMVATVLDPAGNLVGLWQAVAR